MIKYTVNIIDTSHLTAISKLVTGNTSINKMKPHAFTYLQLSYCNTFSEVSKQIVSKLTAITYIIPSIFRSEDNIYYYTAMEINIRHSTNFVITPD